MNRRWFVLRWLVTLLGIPSVAYADDWGKPIGILVGLLLVQFVLFLILREFACWYFKINQRLHLLQSIDAKLGPPAAVGAQAQRAHPTVNTAPGDVPCPQCGKPTSSDGRFCETCGAPMPPRL
jgi:hypothetical protein